VKTEPARRTQVRFPEERWSHGYKRSIHFDPPITSMAGEAVQVESLKWIYPAVLVTWTRHG